MRERVLFKWIATYAESGYKIVFSDLSCTEVWYYSLDFQKEQFAIFQTCTNLNSAIEISQNGI